MHRRVAQPKVILRACTSELKVWANQRQFQTSLRLEWPNRRTVKTRTWYRRSSCLQRWLKFFQIFRKSWPNHFHRALPKWQTDSESNKVAPWWSVVFHFRTIDKSKCYLFQELFAESVPEVTIPHEHQQLLVVAHLRVDFF